MRWKGGERQVCLPDSRSVKTECACSINNRVYPVTVWGRARWTLEATTEMVSSSRGRKGPKTGGNDCNRAGIDAVTERGKVTLGTQRVHPSPSWGTKNGPHGSVLKYLEGLKQLVRKPRETWGCVVNNGTDTSYVEEARHVKRSSGPFPGYEGQCVGARHGPVPQVTHMGGEGEATI